MKNNKKVIARFTGKGFKLSKGGKIEHSSTQICLDKDYFLASEGDSTVMDVLQEFGNGITQALKNHRVKPGSLRISFQILEK